MILTSDEVKTVLKVDLNDDDIFINLLIENAEGYIYDAVGTITFKNVRNLNKAKLISLVLIDDWYNNRSLTKEVSEKVRYSIQSLMLQLQMGVLLEQQQALTGDTI